MSFSSVNNSTNGFVGFLKFWTSPPQKKKNHSKYVTSYTTELHFKLLVKTNNII